MNNKDSTKPISEIMREIFENSGFENRMNENKLREWWAEIVGKKLDYFVTDFSYRDKKLFIRINSAAARNELLYLRNEIKKRLNFRAGNEMVKEIVLN